MKQFLVTLLIITGLSFPSLGQENGRITGNVIDGNVKTVESATITLLRAVDSSVAKMSVADKNGNFTFDAVKEGKYLVAITAVGHQKGFSETFQISSTDPVYKLKTIELIPLAKTVGGVTVTAKKPLIEQKIDRTVVNVEASVTNVGNSALEVLEKAPGVSVDKDGNISLKGKQGVQIYIDGRPSYLSGADLANLLRSMTASQLEQIEIMTNPPAKYEAAGNSGVINIKTKRNKQFGYNGSLTTGYTQGRYPRFNESGNFNYRNGKFNFFANASYNRNHRGEDLFIYRNFRELSTKNITSIFDQLSKMENNNHFVSGKVGLDYIATKRTSFGVVLNGFYNPGKWKSSTKTDIFDPNGDLRSKTTALTWNDEVWKNFSSNFNFRHQFDSTGQEITADLDYIQYRSTSFQPLYSSYFDKAGFPTQTPDTLIGRLPQNITIYSGKIDYTLPLKNGAKFEAGLKSSYVETDNNAVYNNVMMGNEILDSARSNHFIYDENINAAYVNYSRPLGKKWTGQFGLRMENTIANGRSTGYEFSTVDDRFVNTVKKFKRNYTQLFPTVYLQYKASQNNSFVINYGRRINRPDYESLNPFIHFLDRYTFEQGNPNLKPQFAHNIELSHNYKGIINTTVNYTTTTDIIQQVIEQNEISNETFIKKANIASQKQIGLSISANKEITKWWSGNLYTNVYSNHFKGIVNNEPISLTIAGMMVQVQQQFKFAKTWTAEVSGFYRSKGLEGVIYIKPMKQFNAAISKQVMKNKATIRMGMRDIFAGNTFRGYSKYGNVDAQFKDVNDGRALSLSFSWRFNKGKMNGAGQRKKGGADDEQNRVKVGN